MTIRAEIVAVRRILVALDASRDSLAALEAAAEAAARLRADLVGLFVEDINLLRLADLALGRELGAFGGARALDPARMARTLKSLAAEARDALERVAGRRGLRCSFQTTRGVVTIELLKAAEQSDLVVVGRQGWTPHRWIAIGSTAQALLAQGSRPVLLLREGGRIVPPIVAIVEDTESAWQTVATSAALAAGDTLVVLLATAEAQAEPLAAEIEAFARAGGARPRVRTVGSLDVDAIGRVVLEERAGLVVVRAPSRALGSLPVEKWTRRLECAVLLLR